MSETRPFLIRGFDQWISDIADRSARLAAAVDAASSLDARVPGCPDWALRDLAAHVGRVQRFWAAAVAANGVAAPPSRETIRDPEPAADIVGWLADSAAELIGALESAGPDAPCWTWWAGRARTAESTAGAVARHQAQEAAVHAYDAQETIGRPEPIPSPIAVDGTAEFLQVMAGSAGEWPHAPASVLLVAHEGPTWRCRLDADGAVTRESAREEPDPPGAADATMRGPASDLVLALYRRIPLSALDCDGEALLRRLIDWPNTA